ncbi:MAG: D-alanyl-D-alanine carboxypeptidase family protein [Clostridia bacterium]|nr:D-alanyl-D-alanine carboxypeptidase family protein [Clostridia bacterium]
MEKPARSFNTVKNSNRKARKERRLLERKVLLAILAVAALILLVLAVFLVSSLVQVIVESFGNNDPTPPAETPVSITYTQKTQESTGIYAGELIVVSQKDNLQYQLPEPGNLVSLLDLRQPQNGTNPYQILTIDNSTTSLQYAAAHAANAMLTDFYLKYQDNSLIFIDGYRTPEHQNSFSTPVGFSEHQTGLVFTVRTYMSDSKHHPLAENAFKDWIYQNAHKYGIICRYPDAKETLTGVSDYDYCFRYVGIPHATYIYQNNLCLEEYVALLQTRTVQNPLTVTTENGSYQIYYVAASADQLTTLTVPKDFVDKSNYLPPNRKTFDGYLPAAGEYTVSGDNKQGFIITVNLTSPGA